MALQLYPDVSKTTTTSDGTTYAYIRIPAATPTNPTFLLLHGFPKLKFRMATYGYGDTDKPVEVEAYSHKRMADQIIEILEGEGLRKVIGVGHDWGSALFSMTALAHPAYFSAIAFLAVGYVPPGPFQIDVLNSFSEQYFGHQCYGYMKFFNEDGATAIVQIIHPRHRRTILLQTKTDESKNLDIPALLIAAEYDYVCHAAFQKLGFEKHLKNGRIEQLACSHWVPSEKPDEVVALLEEWVGGIETAL
ncbi:hypothetical protein ZTR_06340 [Talaromyces verruculosus]|nr:hypothetical protein ZTR_06340 [Talaromyces verruculosus]